MTHDDASTILVVGDDAATGTFLADSRPAPRVRTSVAPGVPPRRARPALAEGVRARADARERADAGLHQGGAVALDLGLQVAGLDADARFPRLPPAPQARHPRRPLRGQ